MDKKILQEEKGMTFKGQEKTLKRQNKIVSSFSVSFRTPYPNTPQPEFWAQLSFFSLEPNREGKESESQTNLTTRLYKICLVYVLEATYNQHYKEKHQKRSSI